MAKKYLLYIHEERFEGESSKSELVNKLLEQYYSQSGGTGSFQKAPEQEDEDNTWAVGLSYYEAMGRVYDTTIGEPVQVTKAQMDWLKDHGRVIR